MLKRIVCLILSAATLLAPSSLIGNDASNSSLINKLHQREWVRLDDDGKISGKVFTLGEVSGAANIRPGARIVISSEGKVVQETKSEMDGSFEILSLKPGTYAFQVAGDLTRAAFALHVLPSTAQHLGSELSVYAAVIPAEKAQELVDSNLVPEWESNDVYYRSFDKDPLEASRSFNRSHQVTLQDGALVGRVSRPGWTFSEQDLTGSTARIVRSGQVVAEVPVSRDGYFSFEQCEPGVYDLFVAGDDGFAILSFEAIEGDALAADEENSVRLVSTAAGIHSDCLCCEMIQQPEISCCEIVEPCCEETVAIVEEPCLDCAAPIVGGGLAGPAGFYGGGGGFGGGGFGGGLGGIAGAAGLAVGIAALADDDDGFNQNAATGIAP